MSNLRITVAVLTRNRPHFLRQALASILGQRDVELDVLVLDNASTDDTPAVVAGINDPRITYLRNEEDIGIVRNWNRAIKLAVDRSPFTCIFHDDDIMLPGYLSAMTDALHRHPSAGLAVCLCELTRDNIPFQVVDPGATKDDLNNGLDFLELVVEGRAVGIGPPMNVFRSDVLRRVAPADSPHTRAIIDISLYYRAAAISDVVMIKRVLSQYRFHENSDTNLINRNSLGVDWYGTMAARIDVIAILLRSERALNEDYRKRLIEQLVTAHAHQSIAIHTLIPQMYHTWDTQRAILLEQLECALPPDQPFILIDDLQLGLPGDFNGRRVIPFIERDGQYWGPPVKAADAVSELQRMRTARVASRLVVIWSSFWWLDDFGEFDRYLRRECRLVMDSPHALIFDISSI